MVAISLERYLNFHIPVASTPKESNDRLYGDSNIEEEVIKFKIWLWLKGSIVTSFQYPDFFRTRRYDTLDMGEEENALLAGCVIHLSRALCSAKHSHFFCSY